MPASGLRTSWATPASSLPRARAASRSLRRSSAWSRPRSAGGDSERPDEAEGQDEGQRDPSQRQPGGEAIPAERPVEKGGVDQADHRPGGANDLAAGAVQDGAGQESDGARRHDTDDEGRLSLGDRRFGLSANQIELAGGRSLTKPGDGPTVDVGANGANEAVTLASVVPPSTPSSSPTAVMVSSARRRSRRSHSDSDMPGQGGMEARARRAAEHYREGIRAMESGEERRAHEFGAIAHDLGRAAQHAANAEMLDRMDEDLPPPPGDSDQEAHKHAVHDLQRAYDRITAIKSEAEGRNARFYLDAALDLYRAARRDAEEGRDDRASELARAAEAMTHVPQTPRAPHQRRASSRPGRRPAPARTAARSP